MQLHHHSTTTETSDQHRSYNMSEQLHPHHVIVQVVLPITTSVGQLRSCFYLSYRQMDEEITLVHQYHGDMTWVAGAANPVLPDVLVKVGSCLPNLASTRSHSFFSFVHSLFHIEHYAQTRLFPFTFTDNTRPHISNAFVAISMAPSLVWFPPINPLAWTKIPPSIPVTFDSSSSLTPRQTSGRALRESKDSGETGTAWMRQFPAVSSG